MASPHDADAPKAAAYSLEYSPAQAARETSPPTGAPSPKQSANNHPADHRTWRHPPSAEQTKIAEERSASATGQRQANGYESSRLHEKLCIEFWESRKGRAGCSGFRQV